MNEYILDLTTIDYFSLISAVVIIMGAVIAMKELFEKFCSITGIEFSWIKAKKEMRECQVTVKKELAELRERQDLFEKEHRENIQRRDVFNKEIISAIEAIKNTISDMRKDIDRREAEKKFEKLRDDILNFANELSTKKTVSEELISNVYRKINYYNNLHNQYGFENSQAPASIEAIKLKYQDMILKGQITKKEED